MRRDEMVNKICENGVVAVVRAKSTEEAIKISKGCLKGGLTAIEVTYTVPGASDVIKELVDVFGDQLLVGAGTVLDAETARIAILAGAKYIVSPSFDRATALLCNRYQVPYMPGCMTIKEIIEAMEYGASIIKVFPGSAYGPAFLRAIHGPIPQAVLMPTGGVNLDNVGEWIANGAVAVGVGGNLTKGTEEEIAKNAKAYLERVSAARGLKYV